MNNIYVNCGGSLQLFNSKKDVMDFYEDCILMSEGSERERYTEIYFSVKQNLKTNKRCFTDGTNGIYASEIDPDKIDCYEEQLLMDNYNVSKERLLYFKANNYLSQNNNRIYDSTVKRYKNLEELYNDYIVNSREVSFYIMKEDSIVCIDATEKDNENYCVEEFPLKDYKFADLWLKGEIEYEDYLNSNKSNDMDI